MSEPAVAVAPPAPQRQAVRLGAFIAGPRVIDAQQRLGKVALFSVAGSAESPQAGVSGFAYCTALGEPTPEQLELAKAVLGRIANLSGPTVAPVLDAGVSGRIGYVVEAAMPGERLSDRLSRERRFSPWQMATVAGGVGAALDLAHRQRISHGMVVPMTIWVGEPSGVRLGGFGLSGRGPARDQEMLAALCIEMLSGTPWKQDPAVRFTLPQLVERIRGSASGLTEPLAAAIARGLLSEPAERFPTVLDQTDALRRAVQDSAADVAAGAWEAISRRDMPMAALLTEMTAGYDPVSPEVPLLRVRLNGGEGGPGARLSQAPMQSMETLIKAQAAAPAPRPSAVPPAEQLGQFQQFGQIQQLNQPEPDGRVEQAQPVAHPMPQPAIGEEQPESTGASPRMYDETELQRLFAPEPIVIAPPKGNPWVIFLTVVFALIALMTVLAAIMFTRT